MTVLLGPFNDLALEIDDQVLQLFHIIVLGQDAWRKKWAAG